MIGLIFSASQMNDGTTNTLLAVLTLVVGIPVGSWILNLLREWWKHRESRDKRSEEAREKQAARRREDETARDTRRRQEDLDAVDHLNKLIERKDRDHEEARKFWEDSRKLWERERGDLIRERDRISALHQGLLVQVTAMQDRLAVYQGIGPEGAERMDPVLVMQDDGTIRWANDPAGTFLGYPTRALLGKPMTKVIPQTRHDVFRQLTRQLVDRLMSLPENLPVRHARAGQVRRKDASDVWVCVLMNLFRIYHPCSKCSNIDAIPVFRIHLRQRWESADVSVDPPLVPLNSSDGDVETSVSIEPGADDRDEAVVAVPAP